MRAAMPRIHANNRFWLRTFLLATLVAGLFGYWYAWTHWQVDLAGMVDGLRSGDADYWLDLVSQVLETVIQIFFGILSG